jgi:hypothetical protein
MRKGVLKSLFHSNPSIFVLAMSASFRVDDQSKFASILLVKPTDIIWGLMARRGILFCVSVLVDDVADSMFKKIFHYLKDDSTYKVILYSNTNSAAEGHLLALVKKTLAPNLIDGNAIPLTGDSGLMMKNWLVALFSGLIHSHVSIL